jgi:hypothetical protein
MSQTESCLASAPRPRSCRADKATIALPCHPALPVNDRRRHLGPGRCLTYKRDADEGKRHNRDPGTGLER